MLNGIDPIFIFQFSALSKSLGPTISKIPLVSDIPTVIDQPPIPIYLSQDLTGLIVDSEDKNVDIQTDTETKSDGTTPDVSQKGIQSTVTINIVAKKTSIGVALLAAMVDLAYDKVTSKEYSISYLNGVITVFRAVLHSFSISQNADTERVDIRIELSRGTKQPTKTVGPPETPRETNVQVLDAG